MAETYDELAKALLDEQYPIKRNRLSEDRFAESQRGLLPLPPLSNALAGSLGSMETPRWRAPNQFGGDETVAAQIGDDARQGNWAPAIGGLAAVLLGAAAPRGGKRVEPAQPKKGLAGEPGYLPKNTEGGGQRDVHPPFRTVPRDEYERVRAITSSPAMYDLTGMDRTKQARVTVPLDELHAMETVSPDAVRAYSEDRVPSGDARKTPYVALVDGKLFILDGHNKLTAAKLAGNGTADVILINADKAHPRILSRYGPEKSTD